MADKTLMTGFGTGVPLVIITGLSGAGKSTAMQFLEGIGCFCVDNLPPSLIPTIFELYRNTGSTKTGVAIVSDVRSGALFDDFAAMVDKLHELDVEFVILYLDCSTATLMNRFKEVRREHPLVQTTGSMRQAIELERQRLASIQKFATHKLSTSNLASTELRQELIRVLLAEDDETKIIKLNVTSFGFKYGVLGDADFVFDVRFLTNPYYEIELRPKSGLDDDVYRFVMSQPLADPFFDKLVDLIEVTLESFIQVGKMALTIGIGCTGGRHRSVAFARRLSEHFTGQGKRSSVHHRDLNRPQV